VTAKNIDYDKELVRHQFVRRSFGRGWNQQIVRNLKANPAPTFETPERLLQYRTSEKFGPTSLWTVIFSGTFPDHRSSRPKVLMTENRYNAELFAI
jgi:hypothetical protein